MTLPITTCVDGAGSLNNTTDPSLTPALPNPYVPPNFCVGVWEIPACSDVTQEQYAAENLNISGAPVNVFRLLGNHEQGKLIDLVGLGRALNGSSEVFDSLAASWISDQTGIAVLTAPAWIGYDFGVTKTSYGQDVNAKGQPAAQSITTLRITQPTQNRRALQVRIERSTGDYHLGSVQYTGTGNGSVLGYTPGPGAIPGTFMLTAVSPTSFTVFFTGDTTVVVGVCTVGQRFNCMFGSFTVVAGSIPFVPGDLFSLPIDLDWYRVDVVNLPDSPAPVTVRLKQAAASRYWRVVPISFSGVATNQGWEVEKLELFDYQQTSLDDIQDQLLLENRDRDYAKASIQLKAAYQPFDAISDLSKFGFQVADVYTFTTVFSTMVAALGRPIVVGDVLEVPSELQYDHNLRPVRKFLEVTDTSWAADGYTTAWRPITYRFQASQLIPSQEHRDLLGTVDTQKYVVDDGTFFRGIEQISTGPLTAAEANESEANLAVPEKGTNVREEASGTNRFNAPGTYDGVGLYTEDGLPPDGQAYTEGFKLPDVSAATDQDYFRLNYDPRTGIPARLYKFSSIKNRWLFVETDRRPEKFSHKPSQLEIFNQPVTLSLTAKSV
jgi:hypothetical protein